MGRPSKYPAELRERATRLARETGRPISRVAADLGIQRDLAPMGAHRRSRRGARWVAGTAR